MRVLSFYTPELGEELCKALSLPFSRRDSIMSTGPLGPDDGQKNEMDIREVGSDRTED